MLSYRFGFNGKENVDEMYNVTGSFQDYGMRDYDTRIARFIRVDTMFKQYPMLTPYQFASLSPIQGIDLDGNELKKVVFYLDQHSDKSLFIKNTTVDIDPNKTFKSSDGKTFAKTEVYLILRGNKLPKPSKVIFEPTQNENKGLKPSASYDYTKTTIDGKMTDDVKYIFKDEHIYDNTKEVVKRDFKAPENTAVEELLEGAEVLPTNPSTK